MNRNFRRAKLKPSSVAMSPWIVLFLVSLTTSPIASNDEDICANVSPCSCVFPNGTGIDLAPGKLEQYATYQMSLGEANKNLTMYNYYFFPCKDGKVNITDKPIENHCSDPVAICRHKYQLDINQPANSSLFNITTSLNIYEKFGTNNLAKFDNNGKSIIYENKPSYSTVQLECSPNAKYDTLVVDDSEPDAVVFRFYSKNACMKQIKEVSTRSAGSTLLIIFFTLVLFYLVLGVLTKRFLMGATGMEVIPNLGFWRDLPVLCRDGWVFMRSGFRVPPSTSVGPTSPNPNSYDSI